ncbi:ParB N-terminal domain-containing protein [Yoonia sp.]|uniref:ParB N-terminal domain-containing protein n=1 Tax=Yoonia sp. TaxID=2212373 RepID=UPI002DF9A4EB|nr:ParB N-terminal domain-containing protein [Yoonia sp.]
MSKINIANVRVNGGTQSRAAINPDIVHDYSEAMADGAAFPPIVVFHDGSDYWLADGFHRYQAASLARIYEIDADIRQGSQRDAVLFSVGANASHGLRRTNDDKRRAVMVLLNDTEWSKWSQVDIAKTCGVSREYVNRLTKEASCDRSQDATRTVTRNGTTYEQNTANIGSGSKPDQEQVTTSEEPDQEPDTYGYAKLTEEALLDLANGLRADLDEEKAKRKAAEAEVKALKAKLRDFQDDDKDAVIRRLQASVNNAENAKWKALEDRDAFHRQLFAVKKERDAALKSLQSQEVTL